MSNQSPVHPILDWFLKHVYYSIILFVLAFWLCGGIPKCSTDKEDEIKALKLEIKQIKKERAIERVRFDSLRTIDHLWVDSVINSKAKTKKIINRRDETNLTILGMPDNELLRTFSEFDTYRHKNK